MFNKQKGRALRKPCLICPILSASVYRVALPPLRATTRLFEPTLCVHPQPVPGENQHG
jgi:hypothetical protein